MKVYQAEMSMPSTVPGITLTTVAWIPEDYCEIDKLLDLKNRDGKWEGPYTVKRVYHKTGLDSAYVREHQRIDLGSIDGR